MDKNNTPPYTCKFCGSPSWYEPVDQLCPPDYCHEGDHGEAPHVEPNHGKADNYYNEEEE